MSRLFYMYRLGSSFCLVCLMYLFGRFLSTARIFDAATKPVFVQPGDTSPPWHSAQFGQTKKLRQKPHKRPKERVYSRALEGLLQQERGNIHRAMEDYRFREGGQLEDHVYELGGNPVKAMVSFTVFKVAKFPKRD